MVYKKVKDAIFEKYIKNVDESDILPSERQLASEFSVSRPTIRKALAELEDDDCITKLSGIGYIIKNKNNKYIDHELDSFIGFFQDAKEQGKSISSKIIRQSVVQTYKYISNKLILNKDDLVFVLERIRYVDDEPICIAKSFVPLKLYPDIINHDFSTESLFEVLQRKGLKMEYAKRSIEVSAATKLEKLYLELKENEPIFVFNSIGFDENHKPFEYEISKYPAFKTKFESVVSN